MKLCFAKRLCVRIARDQIAAELDRATANDRHRSKQDAAILREMLDCLDAELAADADESDVVSRSS